MRAELSTLRSKVSASRKGLASFARCGEADSDSVGAVWGRDFEQEDATWEEVKQVLEKLFPDLNVGPEVTSYLLAQSTTTLRRCSIEETAVRQQQLPPPGLLGNLFSFELWAEDFGPNSTIGPRLSNLTTLTILTFHLAPQEGISSGNTVEPPAAALGDVVRGHNFLRHLQLYGDWTHLNGEETLSRLKSALEERNVARLASITLRSFVVKFGHDWVVALQNWEAELVGTSIELKWLTDVHFAE